MDRLTPPVAAQSPEGLAEELTSVYIRSFAITGLFAIALFAALYMGRTLFLPLLVALLARFVAAPAVRALRKIGVPYPIGAALVLVVVVGGLGVGTTLAIEPAREALSELPASAAELRRRLNPVRKPIEEVVKATEGVVDVTRTEGDASTVPVEERTVPGRELLTQTGSVVVSSVVVLVLLYFLLASGDAFVRKLVNVLPRFADKRRAVEIVRDIESSISRYLITVGLINVALGLATAGALWLIGMPQPWLWGLLGGALNFVPFLGSVVMACVLSLAAASTLPTLGHVAAVVGAWVLLSSIEGLVVTPSILGRSMTMSAFTILVSVLLWSWLWGVPGAFVAVPVLVALKSIVDAIPRLRPVGIMLERDTA